jgi:small subunit ribosomal protein S7
MRKKKVIKRHPVKPDKKFASNIVSQLVNKIMKGGEKRKATKIVYQAAQIIEENTSSPFLTILSGALENVKPSLETRSRRMGGSKQRIPVKVEEKRAVTLALRWMVKGAQEKKSSKSMFENLAEEIKNAYNKSGEAYKKKENIHKEAMGNMAFANLK